MPIVKIATLNIDNGDCDDKTTLPGLSRLIRWGGPDCAEQAKPDIVLINEVGRNTIPSGGRDQMRLLADGAGYPYWVFAARDWYAGGELGEGVLSMLPLVPDAHYLSRDDPHVTKLPFVWGPGQKIILHMEALLPSVVSSTGRTPLHVFVTRFNVGDQHQAWRVQSAQIALNLLASVQGPAVFGGDLNELPFGPAIQLLSGALRETFQDSPYPPTTCDGIAIKHGTSDETDRVDYLFFRDQHQGAFEVPWYKGWCNTVTDHPFVVSRLERHEPTECSTVLDEIESLLEQRQELYEAKQGLDPRNPADRRKITEINAQIGILNRQIEVKRQQATQWACT